MSQLAMGEESPNSGKEPEVAPISCSAGLKLVSEGRGCRLAQSELLSDLQAFSGGTG